ncbi:MAG: hypothetical protein LLG04_07270 [Parachlamydia sp.]|nr:hypothetical protein [Parachlamydia sp.]
MKNEYLKISEEILAIRLELYKLTDSFNDLKTPLYERSKPIIERLNVIGQEYKDLNKQLSDSNEEFDKRDDVRALNEKIALTQKKMEELFNQLSNLELKIHAETKMVS